MVCCAPLSTSGLQGKTIGLVLSGGGARGIAHLGLLKALHEHEVPIDYIGGTSMGAFVAGLYAKHRDWKKVYDLVLDYSKRFTTWGLVKDLTVPLTAWCSGASFNTLIRTSGFDDTQIEDYPIPFFCTTTNITTSKLEVHTEGTAWRFVRASMSLTYFIPPICDGANLLVDGGYINNLPADVMRQRGADTVIACDIGGALATAAPHCLRRTSHRCSVRVATWQRRHRQFLSPLFGCCRGQRAKRAKRIDRLLLYPVVSCYAVAWRGCHIGEFDRKFTDYGDSLSGVWLLWKKLNWFASPVHIPSMSDINAHLAYISCDQQLEQVRQSRMMDLYIKPAVGQYGVLQWAAFHEIYKIGEAHAWAEVRRWLEAKQAKQLAHTQS